MKTAPNRFPLTHRMPPMPVFCGIGLWFAWMCLWASPGRAHPISITWADVTVTKSKVSVALKVLAEDFLFFGSPKLNDEDYVEAEELSKAIEKHKEFLLKNLVIIDQDDRQLQGEIVGVKPFEMEPKGIHIGDLMAYWVVYRIEFPLPAAPTLLTIFQQFGSQEITRPALMQLTVTQEGFPAEDPVALDSDRPHTTRFDWDRLPLSSAELEEARRKRKEKERQENLGLSNFGSIYSFIYITRYEVRHEILIPFLTMENWFPVDRKDLAFLEIEEQDAARAQIEEFFCEGNPVEIDGIEVKPVLSRLDYIGLEFKDLAQPTVRRRLRAATARVGVILSYSTKGPPRHVKMTCDMLDWQVRVIHSVVFAYDEVLKADFNRYEPAFEWTGPEQPPLPPIKQLPPPLPPPKRSLPLASLGCLVLLAGALIGMKWNGSSWKHCTLVLGILGLGAAAIWPYARWEVADPFAAPSTISEEDAGAIFTTLHKNIFRAFDYQTESDIYDALAASVSGELLSQLYRQIRQGLEMQEQGGAISRIREVKILESRKESLQQNEDPERRGFDFHCTWTVNGTVEHWSHIHSRTNQYGGVFTVQVRENAWKITDLEVLSEKRIKFDSRPRMLKKPDGTS